MRMLWTVLALAVLAPAAGYGETKGLEWAYPVNPPPGGPNPNPRDPPNTVNRNLILSSYTGLPKMPDVVATGKPAPCMQCHLANGNGHPENSDISGLSINYIIEQVHAYREGDRVDPREHLMVAVAKTISEADLQAAAAYYASIPSQRQVWTKTVVSEVVPKGEFTFGSGSYRNRAPDGATEPLAQGRVVEFAADDDLVRARDQVNGGFIQYVRPDDLALGETLAATTGEGRPVTCGACHGVDFRGKGDVPRLAGRQPLYLIRALNDIKTGATKTKGAMGMKSVAAGLSDRDIVAVAAYFGSMPP